MTKELAGICFILTMVSCSKPFNTTEKECKSMLIGYKAVLVSKADSLPECIYGAISKNVSLYSQISTFPNTANTNQGAYDTATHCYYVFGSTYPTKRTILYKIDLEGQITTLTNNSLYLKYDGLLYSRFNNKLYAFRRNKGASGVSVCEITVSAKEFSAKEIIKDMWGIPVNATVSSTISNKTGNVYFRLGTDSTHELYRYSPVETQVKLLLKENNLQLFGMCYNAKDNMIYCMKQDSLKTHFVKISTDGKTVVIDTIPFRPDPEYFSAVIDLCDNEYIFTGKVNNTNGYIIRLNMNGTLLSKDTTAGILQALTITN